MRHNTSIYLSQLFFTTHLFMYAEERVKYGSLALVWLVSGLLVWKYGTGVLLYYGGDVIIVGFMMWLVLAFWPKMNPLIAAGIVFTLAVFVEVSQIFDMTTLQAQIGDMWFSLLFGSTFEWFDMVAYAFGVMVCLPITRETPSRLKKNLA